MKKIIILFTMIGLLLMGCSSKEKDTAVNGEAEKNDKITIKLVHDATEDHPQGIGANLFKDLVEERLGESVEVVVYPNSSLFNIKEGLEALQAGNIQILSGPTAALVGMESAYQLYDMPFLFESTEKLRRFDKSEHGLQLREKIEDHNLKILSTWFGSFKQITNSKGPVKQPEDLEGVKMRVMSGGLLEEQYTMLGASAVVLPYSELYVALQQGTVDGQENPFTEIATAKFYEVQDYLTVTNHAAASYPFITNKEFWEGLPEDIRQELEEIVAEVEEEVYKNIIDIAERDLKVLEDAGIEITKLSEEEREKFKKEMSPLYDKYRDSIGGDILDAAINFE